METGTRHMVDSYTIRNKNGSVIKHENLMIVFQNKWCRITSSDTNYVLQSKTGKYADKYFTSLTKALNYIGINH